MILHKSISGQFVRRIEFGTESTSSDAAERDAKGKDVSWHTGPISLLAFSDSLGFLVGYAAQKLSLCVYSVNGDFIARTSPKQMLATMVVSPVGDMLVAGGSEGTLEIYSIHNLSFLRKVNFQKEPAPITALSFGGNCQYLFIGTEAGEVWISTDPKIRLEMLDAAINKTFSGIL
jgi:WD40 repeat protein